MTDTKRPDPLKYCFLKLFKGKCTLNNAVVPVLSQIPNDQTIPSVVLVRESATGEENINFGGVMGLLSKDDPHYNANQQYLINQEVLRDKKGCIGLYISAKKENELSRLQLQIQDILDFSRIHHYTCCSNYDFSTQNCSVTNAKCDALTVTNRYSRTFRCPYTNIQDSSDPHYRKPGTWYNYAGIDIDTVTVTEPDFIEDTSLIPAIYGAIIKINFNYHTSVLLPVRPGFTINTNEEVK